MSWHETVDPELFLAAAGPLLLPDPGRHSIALTQVENVRARPDETRFAWWEGDSGAVTGAALYCLPYPAVICAAPDEALGPLMQLWDPERISGPTALAVQAAALAALPTGGTVEVTAAERLFRLETLVPPTVPGRVRTAEDRDYSLVLEWFTAFVQEARILARDVEAVVKERLDNGMFLLWEDNGPTSFGGRNREAFGAVRIGPIYTPPEHRGRGYGGAVTAAVTQRALDAGARDVVLYTDLTNPTSNALYPRLGFTPVADRAVLRIRGMSG